MSEIKKYESVHQAIEELDYGDKFEVEIPENTLEVFVKKIKKIDDVLVLDEKESKNKMLKIICVKQKRKPSIYGGKYYSETAKCRPRVLRYCQGKGIDIGCGQEKIKEDAIGLDQHKMPGCPIDIVADACNIPFKDEVFDYVFSSHCLEDIKDTKSALKEWVRILKKGGYLILYVPTWETIGKIADTPLNNPRHRADLDEKLIINCLNDVMEYRLIKQKFYINDEGPEYSLELIVQKVK